MPSGHDGYRAGREYAAKWLTTDHRAVGNTARGYAILSRGRARGYASEPYWRGFCLGVARECRANLHRDANPMGGM